MNNPFWAVNGLPILLAEADGQIVGQKCAVAVPPRLANRIYAAVWGVDYIVLPEFRRQGYCTRCNRPKIRLTISLCDCGCHRLADRWAWPTVRKRVPSRRSVRRYAFPVIKHARSWRAGAAHAVSCPRDPWVN